MKYLILSLALLPLAFTAPVNEERSSHVKIHAVWYHDKVESKSSLKILDADKTKTLAESCFRTLEVEGLKIDLDVDDNGIGKILVNSKSYLVTYQPEVFKDVVCDRLYNQDETVIDCTILLPKPFQELPGATGTGEECFVPRQGRLSIDDENDWEPDSQHVFNSESFNVTEARDLEKRQGGVCNPYPTTRMEGNGNPHQNYRMNQISENLYCAGRPSCTVGYSESTSVTVGWTSEISAAGWISGGFAVETSWTTGNNYECGGEGRETICIWYKTAMTAYTVRNWWVDPCTGTLKEPSAPFVMWSPNRNNKGGGYQCGSGTKCKYSGNGYWIKSGRVGGP